MTPAEKILKKKAFIRAEMDRQLSKEQSDALWTESTAKLDEILKEYVDLPKGVRLHTDNYIFPSAAIYQTVVKEAGQETAYSIIENAAIANTESKGRAIAKMMRLPGMKSLFIHIWDPLTKKMFGADSGFQNVFYPKKKGEYRMDVIACPYWTYFTKLGCPELTKIFCENDDRTYGHLPGLAFERTGTLGKGADRCDFCVRKVQP